MTRIVGSGYVGNIYIQGGAIHLGNELKVGTIVLDFDGYGHASFVCFLLKNKVMGLKRLQFAIEASETDIGTMFHDLEPNESLTHFGIHLGETYSLTCRDWDTIFNSVKNNTVLVELILQVHDMPCLAAGDKTAAKQLLQDLDKCQSLRSLRCQRERFRDDFLTDEALSDLTRENRFSWKLDLALVERDNGGLHHVFQAIAECDMHRKLDLYLTGGGRGMTCHEMKQLIPELARMKVLHRLELQVDATEWDDAMGVDFLHALDQNTSLEHISFTRWQQASNLPSPSSSLFHGNLRFFEVRNHFYHALQQQEFTKGAESDRTRHVLQWPHILHYLAQDSTHGNSLVFWALRTFSILNGKETVTEKSSKHDDSSSSSSRDYEDLAVERLSLYRSMKYRVEADDGTIP